MISNSSGQQVAMYTAAPQPLVDMQTTQLDEEDEDIGGIKPVNETKISNSSGQRVAMYSISQPLVDMQTTQLDEENEDIGGGGEESIDNPNIRYEDGTGSGGVRGGGVEDVHQSALYVTAGGPDYNLVTGNAGADQLTLSFQGEVYVFDAVSPDKVSVLVVVF